MTKRFFLLASIGLLSFSMLFAFSAPERLHDTVFTRLFPEIIAPAAALRDTFPPLEERYDDFMSGQGNNPIDLKDPAVIKKEVEVDPMTGQ
ncbi:MAG: hypothetical protein ACR2K1_14910 [Saprospiraceae bacterium]